MASDLLCSENCIMCFQDLDFDPISILGDHRSDPFWDFPLMSEDSMSSMLVRENDHLPRTDYLNRLLNGGLDLGVRERAIDWIYKAHAILKFEPLSISLCTNYLDRFLSIHELPKDRTWIVQLLAVACLSIAAKMDEVQVPQSIYFQVGDPGFVFDSKSIQKMELLVLSKLNWRVQALTPFSFIEYFLSKMGNDGVSSRPLISRSTELILRTTKGINFLEFKPSEIAAAVAIFVSMEGEDKIEIWNCDFKLLKCLELIKDVSTMPNVLSGNEISSAPQSPVGVLDADCFGYKRRKIDSEP